MGKELDVGDIVIVTSVFVEMHAARRSLEAYAANDLSGNLVATDVKTLDIGAFD